MNALPALPYWWAFAAWIAVQTAAITLMAHGVQRFIPFPRWRRVVWHCCFIANFLLLLAALSGAGQRFTSWVEVRFAQPGSAALEAAIRATPVKQNQTPVPVQGNPGTILRTIPNIQPPKEPSLAAAAEPIAVQPTSGNQAISSPLISNEDRSKTETSMVSGKTLGSIHNWLNYSDLWWAAIWGVGVTFTLLRVGLARCLTILFRRRRPFPSEPSLQKMVRRLGKRLGCARPIQLLSSSRLQSPIAFGILRPAIVLPSNFSTQYTHCQQQAILAHEVAHLAAYDPAWNLLADTVVALFWWHPLIWASRRELDHASEQAADEASLLLQDGPNILAECLLAVGARPWQRHPAVWLGVEGGFRSGLGRRISRLLDLGDQAWQPPTPDRAGLIKTTAPMLVAAAAILCSAWVAPRALTQGDPMSSFKQTWKRSLAAATLAASLGSPLSTNLVLAQTTPPEVVQQSTPASGSDNVSNTPAGDAEADEATIAPSSTNASKDKNSNLGDLMRRRYGLSESPQVPAKGTNTDTHVRKKMDAAMMRRYGLLSGGNDTSEESAINRQSILHQLENITFDHFEFPDNITLGNALKYLNEAACKKDPEGINIIISQAPDPNRPSTTRIDPATGLPLESNSLNTADIPIHMTGPLRNLNLRGVLEVLTLVAGEPIHYSIDNFGVVFSRGKNENEPLAAEVTQPTPRMSEAMMKRYGLQPTPTPTAIIPNKTSNKLKSFLLQEFKISEGKSISDAVRSLHDVILAQDPAKMDVNFIFRTSSATGSNASEATIGSGVNLKKVSAVDILDVLSKVANPPIRYNINDNFVVISPDESTASFAQMNSSHANLGEVLLARTFKINKDVFLTRLETTFGIASNKEEKNSENIKSSVERLASKLGVTILNPSKQIFYNQDTGMLMIRADSVGLDNMAAAIETLGGDTLAKKTF